MTALLLVMLLGYWPLPVHYGITGSFYEYRFNHLHAGFDFSTNGQVGLPVSCFDDGVIYMIKVQKRGYGNVIYVKHPKRNLISVYGHLDRFQKRLASISKAYQKRRHSKYPGTIILEGRNIRVKKGEIIGYSGESGVGWPHFHFELRSMDNTPLDPSELGLELPKEQQPPIFEMLHVYPEDCRTAINGHCRQTQLKAQKTSEGHYRVETFSVAGNVKLSTSVYDAGSRGGKLGLKRLTFAVNGRPVYNFLSNRFSFDHYHQSAAVFDFADTYLSPTAYTYNLFKIPGSQLASQTSQPIDLKRGDNNFEISAEDFNGNKSVLRGTLVYLASDKTYTAESFTGKAALTTDEDHISAENLNTTATALVEDRTYRVTWYSVNENSLQLDNLKLTFSGINADKRLLYVAKMAPPTDGAPLIPVNQTFLSVRPWFSFLQDITLLASFPDEKPDIRYGWYFYDRFKQKWRYLDSVLNEQDSQLTASHFTAADFGVFIDKTPPDIVGHPFYFRKMTAWKITDIGKGVDDTTILLTGKHKSYAMEYDPDRKYATIDKHLRPGNYRITVKDLAGNESIQVGNLRRKRR